MSTPPFMPTQQSAQDYLAQLLQHQQQTTGMTQVSPQVPQHQVPGPKPFEPQPLQPAQAYGPGQGGARQRASMQNFATSLTNLVGQVANKIQEKKQREQQKIFDNFTAYAKGKDDAQSQIEEGKALIKKGMQAGPESPEGADMVKKGSAMVKQGQASYQQNVTNLNDLTTGKNEKNAKMLSKGFGFDDKNAQTPERQLAITAYKKANPGVNDSTAGLMSRMPATQQLTPQAQGQQMAKQAGVSGQPATQGQILKAITDQHNQALKHGIDEAKVSLSAYQKGFIPEEQADGSIKLRPMTQQERGEYQMAQKGVLAWTIKDGKPMAALRNPATNQIIPGTENPDLAPPAYLTERLHEGEFTFTDKDGNVYRVPTRSVSTPILGGKAVKGGSTGATVSTGIKQHSQSSIGPNTNVGSSGTSQSPKGARFIGQGNQLPRGGAEDIAKGIEKGDMPPTIQGLRQQGAAVEAQLARDGFDLRKAELDWKATQRFLATLNGPQQLRLRQAIDFTSDSLGIIDNLYAQWIQTDLPTGFKDYNRAALTAMKHLPGNAGSIATRLDAQINDLTSELGTVYKGGNSSTDESLKLAGENLKGEWNAQTFHDALAQVKTNLQIRRNSIKHSAPEGLSESNSKKKGDPLGIL